MIIQDQSGYWVQQRLNTSPDANGDYVVTLYVDGQNTPTEIPISPNLFRGLDQAKLSGDYEQPLPGEQIKVEIWTALLETAFAQTQGGWAGIDAGNSSDVAWKALTNFDSDWQAWDNSSIPTNAQVWDYISSWRDQGKPVIVATRKNGGEMKINQDPNSPGYNEKTNQIIGDHGYVVVSTPIVNGQQMVELWNPWGTRENIFVPVDQLNRVLNGVLQLELTP